MTAREISHQQAKDIAARLIRSAWRHDGEPYVSGKMMVTHIPARPDLDDDLLMHEYIRQQEAKLTDKARRYLVMAVHDVHDGLNPMWQAEGRVDSLDEVPEFLSWQTTFFAYPTAYVIDAWRRGIHQFDGSMVDGKPTYEMVATANELD